MHDAYVLCGVSIGEDHQGKVCKIVATNAIVYPPLKVVKLNFLGERGTALK